MGKRMVCSSSGSDYHHRCHLDKWRAYSYQKAITSIRRCTERIQSYEVNEKCSSCASFSLRIVIVILRRLFDCPVLVKVWQERSGRSSTRVPWRNWKTFNRRSTSRSLISLETSGDVDRTLLSNGTIRYVAFASPCPFHRLFTKKTTGLSFS